jgi:hypothetical protein
MNKRPCTCGATAHVRRRTRRTADGRDEVIYEMCCPVCGQLGPAIPLEGKGRGLAPASAALLAWNEMIAALRPNDG